MSEAIFRKDAAKKTLTVERVFAAPRSRVWEAHTKSELLEQWWAPKPWLAVTGSFDFQVGGRWHYYMLGPDGTKSWCWLGYDAIDPEKSFSGADYFCDENGKKSDEMPGMHWQTEFFDEGEGTKIVSTITFDTEADLKKIISLGVQEGYTQGLNQLEELLSKEVSG